MSYISTTNNEQKYMLETIGAKSLEELYCDIPEHIRLKKPVNVPAPLSEIDLSRALKNIAENNRHAINFLGAGAYNHYIPAAVDQLSARSEFYTAYTPYQAEVSQGTLVAIYEFQTMICSLTGMDVANAGMYDGATSLAEALLMSTRQNKKKKFIISNTLHPDYRKVVETYAWAADLELHFIEQVNGTTDLEQLTKQLDDSIGGIIIQNPNFFGCLENIGSVSSLCKDKKCNLLVCVTEALSMALLKQAGTAGADIVCGEAQSFGNPIAFGGPMLGFMAAKQQFIRLIPGRLVGKTTDSSGQEAYVLTLQTREQHIRRERATSNICTNEGLCTLRAVIYMSLYGNKLRELAQLNNKIAVYFQKRLEDVGCTLLFTQPFFNEFTVTAPGLTELHSRLSDKGIQLGLPLANRLTGMNDTLLVCVTEQISKTDIDKVIEEIKSIKQ